MQGLPVSYSYASVSDVSGSRPTVSGGAEPRAWARAGGDPKLFAYEVMSAVPGLPAADQWAVAILIDELEDTREPCRSEVLPFPVRRPR